MYTSSFMQNLHFHFKKNPKKHFQCVYAVSSNRLGTIIDIGIWQTGVFLAVFCIRDYHHAIFYTDNAYFMLEIIYLNTDKLKQHRD